LRMGGCLEHGGKSLLHESCVEVSARLRTVDLRERLDSRSGNSHSIKSG
jgi:hypothetical protein